MPKKEAVEEAKPVAKEAAKATEDGPAAKKHEEAKAAAAKAAAAGEEAEAKGGPGWRKKALNRI